MENAIHQSKYFFFLNYWTCNFDTIFRKGNLKYPKQYSHSLERKKSGEMPDICLPMMAKPQLLLLAAVEMATKPIFLFILPDSEANGSNANKVVLLDSLCNDIWIRLRISTILAFLKA